MAIPGVLPHRRPYVPPTAAAALHRLEFHDEYFPSDCHNFSAATCGLQRRSHWWYASFTLWSAPLSQFEPVHRDPMPSSILSCRRSSSPDFHPFAQDVCCKRTGFGGVTGLYGGIALHAVHQPPISTKHGEPKHCARCGPISIDIHPPVAFVQQSGTPNEFSRRNIVFMPLTQS